MWSWGPGPGGFLDLQGDEPVASESKSVYMEPPHRGINLFYYSSFLLLATSRADHHHLDFAEN